MTEINSDINPLSLALEMFQAGRSDEAKAQCLELLHKSPSHAAGWNLLGFLHHQAGENEDAVRAFQKAISAEPDFADAYLNVGNIFRLHGQLPKAASAYRKYLALRPNDAAGHMSLGTVLQEQSEYTIAASSFRAVLRLQPGHVDAQTNLGYALKKLGRYEEAETALRTALDLNPESAEGHNNLGTVLRDLRKFGEAAAASRAALRLNPDFVEAHTNLGHALFDLGDIEAAIAAFNRALEIRSDDVHSHINLAGLGERANRLDIAMAAVESGLNISPEHPSLHLAAAKCERRAGEVEAGIARLERVDPAQAEDIIAIDIAFELGHLFNKSDNAERAFDFFTEGNRLTRNYPAHREIKKTEFLGLIDAIDRRLTAEWLETWSDIPPPSGQHTPAFIVGFPRSGTTLTEQILAAHPLLKTLDEKPALDVMLAQLTNYPASLAHLGGAQADKLRNIYFDNVGEFVDIHSDALLIDKMPLNIIHAVSIQRFFPTAKFILVVRHPCDVCLSCFMQNFTVNSAMANFFTLDDAARLYAKVMRLWQKTTRLMPLNYHIVRYEDLVGDFEMETRKMLDFLAVAWDSAVTDYATQAKQRGKILSPSYHQVTQNIYQSATYRWRRYQDRFAGVKSILEPFVEHFGYSWDQ